MASGREKNVGRTFLLSTHTSHVKVVGIINKRSCDAVFFKTDNFGDANQNVGRAQKVRLHSQKFWEVFSLDSKDFFGRNRQGRRCVAVRRRANRQAAREFH